MILNRFIISINYDQINFNKYPYTTKISDFIDNETLEILDNPYFNVKQTMILMKETIDFIYQSIGLNAFRKYNPANGKFYGSFNLSAFESVLIGIALNLETIKLLEAHEIENKIKNIYSREEYINASARGIKVLSRFERLIKFSKEYFSE